MARPQLLFRARRHTGPLLVVLLLATTLPVAAAREPAAQPGLVSKPPAEGRAVKTPHGYMVAYETKVPGTDVTFQMVPIPGGRFTIGSPADEEGRQEREGPQFTVEVAPFWMGRCEVTWAEYKPFMGLYEPFKEFSTMRFKLATPDGADAEDVAKRDQLRAALKGLDVLQAYLDRKVVKADAITTPTKLYDPSHTFEYGDDPRQAAVTMTQYAAKHYTKWLSSLTGQYFRLPTEAEWEYACRAGSTTAYHFGDDPADLDEFAWYFENAEEGQAQVGLKKPNPWGLHDMHGNVAEWVLDELLEDGYTRFAGKTLPADSVLPADRAVAWPQRPYPCVVRGGHWDSDPEECRSASRLGSHDEDWKGLDPNLPLSPWWFTSDPARGVGFRLVRPLAAPDEKFKQLAWEANNEMIELDISDRLEEGRGAEGLAVQTLPAVIDELKEARARLEKLQPAAAAAP